MWKICCNRLKLLFLSGLAEKHELRTWPRRVTRFAGLALRHERGQGPRRAKIRLAGLGLFFLLVFSGVAEAKKGKRKMKKRVVIDFQDELLEGNVSNPSIFHLFHKKQLDYGRLIRLRKNFLPEMRRTAREIDP